MGSVFKVGAHFKNAMHDVGLETISDATGYIDKAIGTKRDGNEFIEFFSLIKFSLRMLTAFIFTFKPS